MGSVKKFNFKQTKVHFVTDAELYKQIKLDAVNKETTVKEIINESLRRYLSGEGCMGGLSI